MSRKKSNGKKSNPSIQIVVAMIGATAILIASTIGILQPMVSRWVDNNFPTNTPLASVNAVSETSTSIPNNIPTEIHTLIPSPFPTQTPVFVPTLTSQPTTSSTQNPQVQPTQIPLGDVATLNIKRPLSLPAGFPFGHMDGTFASTYLLYVNGNLVGKLTNGSQLILSVNAGTVNVQVIVDYRSDDLNAEALKSAWAVKSDILVLALKSGDVINLECGSRWSFFMYLKQKP